MNVSESTVSVHDGRLETTMLSYLSTLHNRAWPGVDGLTTDIVLQGYWTAAVAGLVPNRGELLRRHPELAAELLLTSSEELNCGPLQSVRAD